MFSAKKTEPTDVPPYDRSHPEDALKSWAGSAATQIGLTVAPLLKSPLSTCRVIEIGCGRGNLTIEIARRCRTVVGLEPNPAYAESAEAAARTSGLSNIKILRSPIHEVAACTSFDLAIMDNVLEHIEDQRGALHCMSGLLKVGGVFAIIVPNRLWPLEVHYRLPFLSYLPLPAANLYLRLSGRGRDYRDSSYAPTYWALHRLLRARAELDSQLTLPAQPALTRGGSSVVYRAGIELIRRWPRLWAISKAFFVIGKKVSPTPHFDR